MRVTLVVEQDEALDPLHVAFLGAQGVVPQPQDLVAAVQERRARGRHTRVGRARWGGAGRRRLRREKLLIHEAQGTPGVHHHKRRLCQFDRQMAQKGRDLGLAQRARVSLTVEQDELLDEVGELIDEEGVGLALLESETKLIQEFRRCWSRRGGARGRGERLRIRRGVHGCFLARGQAISERIITFLGWWQEKSGDFLRDWYSGFRSLSGGVRSRAGPFRLAQSKFVLRTARDTHKFGPYHRHNYFL